MFSLTLATLDATWLHQTYIRADSKDALELVSKFLLHSKHAADVVAEEVFSYLDLYLESIEIIDSINDKHVLRFKLLHFKDDALNLRWEYVDSTDDEHIVASAYNA